MNGPTRAPDEEIAYDEGITQRQAVIMAGLVALIFIAIVIMVPAASWGAWLP
jgi:hypothetical protein